MSQTALPARGRSAEFVHIACNFSSDLYEGNKRPLVAFPLFAKMPAFLSCATSLIIMLTAKAMEQDIVRALDASANDYIVKPFQPNELMARLRRYLRSPA